MKKPYLYTIRFILLVILIASGIIAFTMLPIEPAPNQLSKVGLTYSIRAAEYLGLNARQTYQSILNELNPDVIRLPIYWNMVEPQKDRYDWSEFDFQLQQLEGKDTQIILAIGHKLPRWPECFLPTWTKLLNEEDIKNELSTMVTDVVNRYKDNHHILAWQVENETLFPFGVCPDWTSDRQRLVELITYVKELDPNRKVITTDSGELSTWLRTATLPIDALGISLYRVVYDHNYGYFYWPVNPYYYKLHAWALSHFVDEIIISELQMEPWGPVSVDKLTNEQIYQSFNPNNFEERINFAQRTGATTVLTWGVEWWYYMKEVRNNPEYWNWAIKYFSK